MQHKYRASALEPRTPATEPTPSACPHQQEKPPEAEACSPQLGSSPSSPQLEKSQHGSEDPAQPKVVQIYLKAC